MTHKSRNTKRVKTRKFSVRAQKRIKDRQGKPVIWHRYGTPGQGKPPFSEKQGKPCHGNPPRDDHANCNHG